MKFGREKINAGDNFEIIYTQWKDRKITARKAIEILNLKNNTFYPRVKEYENMK